MPAASRSPANMERLAEYDPGYQPLGHFIRVSKDRFVAKFCIETGGGMRSFSIRNRLGRQGSGCLSVMTDGLKWTGGIGIVLASMVLLTVAIKEAPKSVAANNNNCFQQIAKDENLDTNAFFRNPVQQDDFVRAVTVCSR
jgi:hypothetical protein